MIGKPTGEHAEPFARANVDLGQIEVLDERTIAIVAPKKGRLVYSKE